MKLSALIRWFDDLDDLFWRARDRLPWRPSDPPLHCSECRFFEWERPDFGRCRRHSPSAPRSSDEQKYLVREMWGETSTERLWPLVDCLDWCGEGRRASWKAVKERWRRERVFQEKEAQRERDRTARESRQVQPEADA